MLLYVSLCMFKNKHTLNLSLQIGCHIHILESMMFCAQELNRMSELYSNSYVGITVIFQNLSTFELGHLFTGKQY